MSKIKSYLEDIIATTTDAIITEAPEEIKAYGNYENRADLEIDLFEKVCSEGAKSVWSLLNGLIGDMDWDAEHPLIDEAKNQLLTLIPFGELARDLVKFHSDFDPYDFRNSADDMDEAIQANLEILENHDEGVIEWLDECLENMEDEEIFGDLHTTCKALKERVQLAYSRNF